MSTVKPIVIAAGGYSRVPDDWMPASQTRAFMFEDPILVWLDRHGESNGFKKDTSPYEFLHFIFGKGQAYEAKWSKEIVGSAPRVCAYAYEVYQLEKLQQTWELMRAGTPVIAQAALWWAPERIHGVPDFLALSSWLREHFPEAISEEEAEAPAPNLDLADGLGHYRVIDIKFTSNLTSSDKAVDLATYGSQLRLYSFMLGQLQDAMPKRAHIVQRQPVDSLIAVDITSALGQGLDPDLVSIRDRYLDIKLNGSSWKPWTMPDMHPNISNRDDQWGTAKKDIAENYVPGSALDLVHQIGQQKKLELISRGYLSRASLLAVDPATLPLEQVPGLGPVYSKRIRAVLEANRSGHIVPSTLSSPPTRKIFEFFVDFEFFTNLNVDFDAQWPTLEGCEMIFMVGVGYESESGEWRFRKFIAETESHEAEQRMLDEFTEFLAKETGAELKNSDQVVLYHWSFAEPSHMRRAADRHNKPPDHIWRKLPWLDLQAKVFWAVPIGVPGAWGYDLKEVAKAINTLYPELNLVWPGDLDDGLRAMVMGWRAYENRSPLTTQEMAAIAEYNEVDCQVLWKITIWLRSSYP